MRETARHAATVAACAAIAGAGSLLAWIAAGPVALALAIAAFVIQWIAFVPSYVARSEHAYDLIGSLTYLAVVWAALWLAGDPAGNARGLLIAALVSLWAGRLGLYLFRRVRAAGEDARFAHIRVDFSRFLLAWTMQGLWVVLTLLAALVAIVRGPRELDLAAGVGAAIWLAGFAIEAVADAQKARFRADPANRGRFIDSGLWRWSRHPNYFGEIVLWSGICVMALPTFHGAGWLGLMSPIFVYVLLTRISGIPILEQRARQRWGDDPRWQRYMRATSRLLPLPPRDGA